MEFNIVKELNGQFDPIVLIKADEKPEDALAPKAGRGGCVMSLVGQTIAKRKVTAFGRENITCGGVSAGFGWGTGFKTDEDRAFQATFLSLGTESAKDKEAFLHRLLKKCSRKERESIQTLTQHTSILRIGLSMMKGNILSLSQ